MQSWILVYHCHPSSGEIMLKTEDFTKWLILLLAETFGVSQAPFGFVLDSPQAGLFGAIESLSAPLVSYAPAPDQPSIAAHCYHVLAALRLFEAYEHKQTPEPDWPATWSKRMADEVDWEHLRRELQEAYHSVVIGIEDNDRWPESRVAAALMLLTHCAYHVGQIKQLLSSIMR
jgi:hypothetical protein